MENQDALKIGNIQIIDYAKTTLLSLALHVRIIQKTKPAKARPAPTYSGEV
jgi:hypothetical protein